MQHRPLESKVYFKEREKAKLVVFKQYIRASSNMRAIWGRFKDTAVVVLTIEGLSRVVTYNTLEFYLECWGTLQLIKDPTVVWERTMLTRRFTGTTIPIKNYIAGDVVLIKHDGQPECNKCHMGKEDYPETTATKCLNSNQPGRQHSRLG
jgi:hypothetical protein